MGPPRSSKKRPQANRAHGRVKEILALRQHMMRLEESVECAVLSASRVAKRECKSAEDSGHYSMHVSANNVTCFVGFPSRHQAYDHRNNEQHRDRDSDVERGEQTGD